jgi:hypothetical protein
MDDRREQGQRACTARMALALGVAFAAALLGGCGTVSSQAVGPSPAVRSYELRGSTMQEVVAEAERLCPKGYEVHRSSGRNERLAGEPKKPFDVAAKAWNHAVGWLDTDTDRAQMAVTCL